MSNRLFTLWFNLLGILCSFAYGSPSYGQTVVADETAGTLVSASAPFTVTGGNQQLTTLFHSFQEFSPDTIDVLFQLDGSQGAVDVVISRVTGTNTSSIDAQLQLTGGNSPDFFLINPNGIQFGANASLLLPASFIASTANSILFEDAQRFSANPATLVPILTMSVPKGLQFGSAPGTVLIDQSVLNVVPGSGFALIGGDVLLNGAQVSASGGRLEIGSLGDNQTVKLLPSDFGWGLDYKNSNHFQDIQLAQQSLLNLSGSRGGELQMQAHNLSIKDGTGIESFTAGALTGGEIALRASESISFNGSTPDGRTPSYVNAVVLPRGTGDGGNILIETPRLQARDGAQIASITVGDGDAGDLTVVAQEISASGNIPSRNSPTIFVTTALGNSTGDGGNLNIRTDTLRLTEGAQFGTGINGGQGNGGNLTVQARQIELSGVSASGFNPSGLFSSSEVNIIDGIVTGPIARGNGGQLTVETEQLTINNGATISSLTRGQGDAGNIRIVAQEIDVEGVQEALVPIRLNWK
ncbi:MAG: filamentous hemagglutinin N-terminal domain-containing protein [Cyanobacteria bacterium P01_F01_bin.86]